MYPELTQISRSLDRIAVALETLAGLDKEGPEDIAGVQTSLSVLAGLLDNVVGVDRLKVSVSGSVNTYSERG